MIKKRPVPWKEINVAIGKQKVCLRTLRWYQEDIKYLESKNFVQ